MVPVACDMLIPAGNPVADHWRLPVPPVATRDCEEWVPTVYGPSVDEVLITGCGETTRELVTDTLLPALSVTVMVTG